MGATASGQKQISKNSGSCIGNRKSQTAPKLRSGTEQKGINVQTTALNSYYSTAGIRKNSASAQKLRSKILNVIQKGENEEKQSKIHQYLVSNQYNAPKTKLTAASNSNLNSSTRVQQLPVVQQLSQYTNSGISKFSLTRSLGFSNDSAKLLHKQSQEQKQSIKPHDKPKKVEQNNIIRQQEEEQNRSVKLDKPDKNFSEKVSSIQYKRAQPDKPYYFQKHINQIFNPNNSTSNRYAGSKQMNEVAYGQRVYVDNNRYNTIHHINNIGSNNNTDFNTKINITTSNALNNFQPLQNAFKNINILEQRQKQLKQGIQNEQMGKNKNIMINQQYEKGQNEGLINNNSSISNISDMINSNISPTPINSDKQIKLKDIQLTNHHYFELQKNKSRNRDIRKYQQINEYQVYNKRQRQNNDKFRYKQRSIIRQNQQKQKQKVVVLKNQNNCRQVRPSEQQYQYRTRVRKFKKVQNKQQSFNQCLAPQNIVLASRNHRIDDNRDEKQIFSSRRNHRSSNRASIFDNRESRESNFRENCKDNARDNFKMYYNFDNYLSDSRINSERQIGKISRNNHKSRESQRHNTCNDTSIGSNSINLSQHKLGSKVILKSELSSQNTITDYKSTSKLIYF